MNDSHPRYLVSTPSEGDTSIIVEDTQTPLRFTVEYPLGADRAAIRASLLAMLRQEVEVPLREFSGSPREVASEAVRRLLRDLGQVNYSEAHSLADPYLRVTRSSDYAERFVFNAVIEHVLDNYEPPVSPYEQAREHRLVELMSFVSARIADAAEPAHVPDNPLGTAHEAALELQDGLESLT